VVAWRGDGGTLPPPPAVSRFRGCRRLPREEFHETPHGGRTLIPGSRNKSPSRTDPTPDSRNNPHGGLTRQYAIYETTPCTAGPHRRFYETIALESVSGGRGPRRCRRRPGGARAVGRDRRGFFRQARARARVGTGGGHLCERLVPGHTRATGSMGLFQQDRARPHTRRRRRGLTGSK